MPSPARSEGGGISRRLSWRLARAPEAVARHQMGRTPPVSGSAELPRTLRCAPQETQEQPKPGTAKGGALTMLLRPHVDIRVVRAGDQPARSVVGCIQPTTSARAVRVCARGRRVRRAGAAEPSHALTEAEVRTNYGHNPR